MNRVWQWLKAFGSFWYGFVIGDDWTVAAAVLAALLVTWGLHSDGIAAWEVLPVVVVAAVAWSVRRLEERS
jgi:hypothetical protein